MIIIEKAACQVLAFQKLGRPIPAQPPRQAIEARRRQGNGTAEGDHYHSVANPAKGEPVGERGLPNQGYRPGRKTARRQHKKRKRKGGGS